MISLIILLMNFNFLKSLTVLFHQTKCHGTVFHFSHVFTCMVTRWTSNYIVALLNGLKCGIYDDEDE
jgi:hypothetical protein